MVEERRVHRLAQDVVAAEREAEVRDAARRAHARAALLDQRQRLDERAGVVVVLLDPGRDGQDVRVEDDVLGHEAGLVDAAAGRRARRSTTRCSTVGRLALLVERHHDGARAVAADHARVAQELRLALLERDRVHDRLALAALQPGLEHRPLRAVDHHGQARDLRLGRDHVQEPAHHLLGLEQVGVHVHVDQVRAAAHLLERHVDGRPEVARLDQPPEARRAGDVGALADQHEPGVLRDRERLEPAEPRHPAARRDDPRLEAAHRGRDRGGVRRRRAAARAGDVQEAVVREVAQQARGHVGRLVVAAEGVRQAGVRMRGDEARRDAGELGDVRPQLARAERAVDADDQRVGMLDRGPERLDRLPAQRPARQVDDRDRDPERQLGRDLARGGDRRLRVQRVEDRLDQEQVGAAVGQAADLLGVRLAHLVERVRPEPGIVDLRAERQRDVQRPDRAGDEPAAGRVGRLAREPRARRRSSRTRARRGRSRPGRSTSP